MRVGGRGLLPLESMTGKSPDGEAFSRTWLKDEQETSSGSSSKPVVTTGCEKISIGSTTFGGKAFRNVYMG